MAGAHSLKMEATSRGARMLRTALGPAIASWLEDPGVVEVMLNPDGRLWIGWNFETKQNPGQAIRDAIAQAGAPRQLTLDMVLGRTK